MLNQVVLVGRIVKGIELKIDELEQKSAEVILAVPRSYKNANGEYETDFVSCEVLGGIAENTCKYFKAGDLLGVKGMVRSNNNTINILAEKISFLSSKKEQENNELER